MIRTQVSGQFDQMYRSLVAQDQSMKQLVTEQIMRLRKNPEDTRLYNHPLTKRMEGKWAFSITDEVRIVYEWLGKTTVRFLAIGTHKTVYSSS